jgi:fructuronate reductase
MRYALGRTDEGVTYALRDPRELEIQTAVLAGGASAEGLAGALHGLPGLFPGELSGSAMWRAEVVDALRSILALGMAGSVAAEAERIRGSFA